MYNRIEDIIAAIKLGEMVIILDDASRENEGDLIMAAEHATTATVNFMIKNGRGLICVPLAAQRAHTLGFTRMADTQDRYNTAFTVSVDAREGISTGISAADRAITIKTLADLTRTRNDFDVPGHVFPIIACANGVLQRPGHTEAAVDLATLAGCSPAGVICEVINDDGTMARPQDLQRFAEQHRLLYGTIKDLIRYRQKHESVIQKSGMVRIPTRFSETEFELHCYVSKIDAQEHVALVYGDVRGQEDVMIRVHSECLTGDVFHSRRCDCGEQLETAINLIIENRRGVIVYLRQEGRGIGLIKKIQAYTLQDQQGLDTVDANVRLGFPADLREYSVAAQIINDLEVKSIRLMTNNPQKMTEIQEFGVTITGRHPLVVNPTISNQFYLQTKKVKLGHWL